MKDVMKSYEMPYNVKKIKDIDFETSMSAKFNFDIAFEEITKSFAEQTDEAIINYLYEKYKNTDISKIYVLSKPDFKDFLETMLPKYMNFSKKDLDLEILKCIKKSDFIDYDRIVKKLNVLKILKTKDVLYTQIKYCKSVDEYNILVEDTNFDKLIQEEFDALKEWLDENNNC